MCGIAGFIHKGQGQNVYLQEMGHALQSRGPDDYGEFIERYSSDYFIGFCHRRLSIIDLSKKAHQPMMDQDKKVIVAFNGEIYNFQDIRTVLEGKGHRFFSNSDTEVIIHAYKEWGISFVRKLNGMFAIALYDRTTKDCYLIRDRMGVKPLYYSMTPHGLIFGSELKALFRHPAFEKRIDRHALSLFLFHGYIPAPNSIFERTYKLEPGTYICFNEGKLHTKVYWSIEQSYQAREIKAVSEEEWVERISTHLEESIKKRLISDVPLGCFLSGGIDSSLVAAVMKKVSSDKVKTFTVGFENKNYNEANFAKEIAGCLGTDHYEAYFSLEDAKALIPEIPLVYDEPFADSSQLPMMLLSRFTRQHVTVALSGDGGDELFCGYDRYEDVLRLKNLSRFSKIARSVPFLQRASKHISANSKVAQFFELTDNASIINSAYISYLKNINFIKDYVPHFDGAFGQAMHLSDNLQEQHMLLDMKTYLPEDILTKVDRASMAFSLEARVPFIDDHTFVEMSFDIPHDLKYKNGEKKYLLKKVLEKYIPKHLFDRPKKGFGVPIYDWLRNDLEELLEDVLDPSFIRDQNIFSEKEIGALKQRFKANSACAVGGGPLWTHLKRDGFVDRSIWYIMVFQMWYRKFV